ADLVTDRRDWYRAPTFGWLRRQGHLIAFWIVIPVLLWLLSLGTMQYAGSTFPTWLGFTLGYLSLAAIAGSMANLRWWWRWTWFAGLLAVCATLLPFGWMTDRWDDYGHEYFFGVTTMVVYLLTSMFRQVSGPLVRDPLNRDCDDECRDRPPITGHSPPRLQFSIVQLVAWTTLCAILIAIAKMRWHHYAEISSLDDYTYMVIAAIFVALVTMALLMLRRWAIAWTIGSLFVSLATGLAAGYAVHRQFTADIVWHFGAIYVSQAFIMLLTFWTVRWAGYRLSTKRTPSEGPPNV
ncbi:MAG: hypothetical protein HKN47_08675, partial [Pirellulaceae bacterium]|nr:hypothetical protein [Pirellulaceae bacterium]